MQHFSVQNIIGQLKKKTNVKNLNGMARFGIDVSKRYGLSMPDIRNIAKSIGKNHELALKLFKTGSSEAKIISALIAEPKKLTEQQMESWVIKFKSWDEVDQCMGLFAKTPHAENKVFEWAKRDEEFVKRSAYVIICMFALKRFDFPDNYYKKFYPLLKEGSTDERNFVMKAVNWAIRQIGKRNLFLNKEMVKLSNDILEIESKSSRWIARNAIRELTDPKVINRLNSTK